MRISCRNTSTRTRTSASASRPRPQALTRRTPLSNSSSWPPRIPLISVAISSWNSPTTTAAPYRRRTPAAPGGSPTRRRTTPSPPSPRTGPTPHSHIRSPSSSRSYTHICAVHPRRREEISSNNNNSLNAPSETAARPLPPSIRPTSSVSSAIGSGKGDVRSAGRRRTSCASIRERAPEPRSRSTWRARFGGAGEILNVLSFGLA